jgi:beta-1,4-mannooligosaccharide/beta-1,4-mannosyl-N-acetylglucosamine phosphorylase
MYKILTNELPNIPWFDKPEDCNEPFWRYENNPIINRHDQKNANSIFNSAVVPFEGAFIGVFRCDSKSVSMNLFVGHSEDGLNWKIEDNPIEMDGIEEEILHKEYRYDPRVCFIDDRYYVTWCNGYHGPTIGMAYTYDFKTFKQLENCFLPYNRNGVLFPRKINGKFMLMSRPSDTGHTPFGDIFVSESKDLEYWGHHRYMMGNITQDVDNSAWQSTKIGPGPIPIETSEGWLLIYHGVITTCNGFVYRVGGAILDIDEPWKVKYRTKDYLLGPEKYYECVGDVPNVVFPCATLCDSKTGKVTMYYGSADTVTSVAFSTVDTLIDFIKNHSL